MPVLEILSLARNPILRRRARPVEFVGVEEKKLLDDMLETMYLNQGIGLAAPQIGIGKRIIVVDIGEGPIELINPVVVKKGAFESAEEGCLSVPGVMVKVKRPRKISYKALNRDGKSFNSEAEGLLARAIGHEIDHLDARLIIDYANPIKRIFLKRRLLKGV